MFTFHDALVRWLSVFNCRKLSLLHCFSSSFLRLLEFTEPLCVVICSWCFTAAVICNVAWQPQTLPFLFFSFATLVSVFASVSDFFFFGSHFKGPRTFYLSPLPNDCWCIGFLRHLIQHCKHCHLDSSRRSASKKWRPDYIIWYS